MKKILIGILISLMLMGTFLGASAEENTYIEEKTELELLFDQWAVDNNKKQYMMDITKENYNSGFKEIYRHTTEEGALDWALVWVPCDVSLDWIIDIQVGKTIVHSVDEGFVFKTHYGIYYAAANTFYDLDSISVEKTPDIESVLWQFKIGRPLGDADNDNELTVLDATRIQRVLADLDTFDDVAEHYSLSVSEPSGRFSDYNEDGEVSILDATAIQRYLAGVYQ